MKTHLSDEQWRSVYPIFGFLYGRCVIASRKRQLPIFDHDAQLEWILQVAAELNFHHHYSPDRMVEMVKSGVSLAEVSKVEQIPVTALSLASIVKIPRETVRRKLKKLVEKGFLVQIDEGYMVTMKTIEYYYEEVRRIYADFAATVNTLEALQQSLKIA